MSGSASLAARFDRPQAIGPACFSCQGLQSVLTARIYTMNNDPAGETPRVNDPTLSLSEGQKSCLRLVAKGMSSKEIAREMGLTPQTVDTYVKTSLARLGASNRREAARALVAWEAREFESLSEAEFVPSRVAEAGTPYEPQSGDRRQGPGWAKKAGEWISLPPLGGGYSDLSWTRKTYQALQVAVIAAATFAALALIIAGLLDTFH